MMIIRSNTKIIEFPMKTDFEDPLSWNQVVRPPARALPLADETWGVVDMARP